jgi:uroporphyrinogen-III synthase
MRLLVTRPDPDGARTAEALRAHGHDVLLAAVLRMQPVKVEIPDRPYARIVITSANAARAIAAHPLCAKLLPLPVFAVGNHSADAARATGFHDVRSADGDSRDLLQLLEQNVSNFSGPQLYLAGEDRTADIGSLINAVTVVVYRMIALDRLGEAADNALRAGQIEGVLHFSVRSALAYLGCSARADLSAQALAPVQFCLSAQIAAPLAAAGAGIIRTAPRASEAALITIVNGHSANLRSR